MFGTEVGREVITKRVAIGEHPRERQEYAGHAQSWVAEGSTRQGQPAEREPGLGDQRVSVEHPHQHQVDEEAFHAALSDCEIFVSEVRADDAHVVCAIPAAGGRLTNELQPGSDRRRAWRPWTT